MYKFEIKKVESTAFDTPVVFTDQDRKGMPYGFSTIFREMAWKNYRRAEYEAATRNFNISLGMYPDDRRTIIGRGFSRSRNTLFEGALKDAETVLAQNEYDKEAIYLQALSRYELGDFEDGLRAFRNGMNKRGSRPEFKDGRYQAEGTIEDCIGRFAGPMLTEMKGVIKKMEETRMRHQKMKQKESKYVDDLDIPPPHPCSDFEWNRYVRKQASFNNRLSQLYLGKLNNDRQWFIETIDNPNLISVNKIGTDKMFTLARKALDDLNKRKEILRSRKPYYHIYFKFEECEKGMRKIRAASDRDRRKLLREIAEKMLADLHNQRMLKNTKRCIEIADRIKKHLDKSPIRLLPNKKQLLTLLYNTIGLVYLDLKKFKPHLTLKENYNRLYYWLGFDGAYIDLRMEPLVQETSFPFSDYPKWMKIYEGYMEFADNDLERAWIYHEIGRCYGELHKWDHMVLRGRKCFWAARNVNSLVWIINGLFMMVVGEMNAHNKEESMQALAECLEYAKKYRDETVIEFLLMAKKVLEEKDVQEAFMDTNTLIRKREEFIVGLMQDADVIERAKDLFNRMAPIMSNRKMSICPGVIPKNGMVTNVSKKSIIPGGTGGRLGLHPQNECTYQEFMDLTAELPNMYR